jgi:iron(III) transport system substrate-binding protein
MIRFLVKRFLVPLSACLACVAGAAHAQMAPWEKQLYDAALKEKPITVYTAHYNTDDAAALCAAFEKKYPGLKCNFVRTTAQVAYQRFMQDEQAHQPVASIFSSTDVSHYPELKQKGLLLPYTPHNAALMVDSLKPYNDKDGQYWVTAAALMCLTYNSSVVSEKDAPKNWTDLLDPKWKGKVSIGHPAFSGYVGTWVVLMRKLYGWDYFTKLEKNEPQIGRSVNDTVTMLNAGERIVAAGPSATTLKSADKGNPVGLIYPEEGALLMISPSAIMANAPHPNAARLFMEFLLGTEHAEVSVKDRGESLRPEVKPLKGAKAFTAV